MTYTPTTDKWGGEGLSGSIRIDQKDAENLDRTLRGIKNGVPKVATRALNKTARWGRTRLVRQVVREIAVKQKDIRDRNFTLSKANYRKLSARIGITGARIPLAYFKPKELKKGVSWRISKQEGRKKDKSAFMARVGGHMGVFKRTGADRLPIQELRGPSIPQVVDTSPEAKKIRRKEMDDRLSMELSRQVGVLIDQEARRHGG